jgi:hypothetical protein
LKANIYSGNIFLFISYSNQIGCHYFAQLIQQQRDIDLNSQKRASPDTKSNKSDSLDQTQVSIINNTKNSECLDNCGHFPFHAVRERGSGFSFIAKRCRIECP